MRFTHGIKTGTGLHFDQHALLNNQICQIREIISEHNIFLFHFNRDFLLTMQPHAPNFGQERIRIYFLQETHNPAYYEPQTPLSEFSQLNPAPGKSSDWGQFPLSFYPLDLEFIAFHQCSSLDSILLAV